MQGMNFVSAAFLIALDLNEAACFWGMIQLLNRMQLVQIYDLESQKFKQLTFQTEMLLFEQLPSLAEHLIVDLGLDLQMYTVRWFLSLFFIDLPFEYAQSVLDLFLIDQFKVLIKVSLAIFSVLACQLSRANDQEEVHTILLNIAHEDGFKQMPQSTFFNLAAQFDIPMDIFSLLDKQDTKDYQSNDFKKRETLLTQMRTLRLNKLKVASCSKDTIQNPKLKIPTKATAATSTIKPQHQQHRKNQLSVGSSGLL